MFLWRIAGHSLSTDFFHCSPVPLESWLLSWNSLSSQGSWIASDTLQKRCRENLPLFSIKADFSLCHCSFALGQQTAQPTLWGLTESPRRPAVPRGPHRDTWQPFSGLHTEEVPLVDASGWNSRWPLFQSEPYQRRPLASACKQGKGKPWEGSCVHDLAQLSHHCLHRSPSFAF